MIQPVDPQRPAQRHIRVEGVLEQLDEDATRLLDVMARPEYRDVAGEIFRLSLPWCTRQQKEEICSSNAPLENWIEGKIVADKQLLSARFNGWPK